MPASFAHYLPPALANVNVPAYVLDTHGRIRWLNDAARAVTGATEGQMFTSVLDADDARRARPIFERNLRGERHDDFALDLVRPDGGTTRVEISSAALGPEHNAIGMFGLAVPAGSTPGAVKPFDDRLTPRQHEVLRALASGASTEQIAEALVLSRETVRNHVRHILQRLDARSRLEAVAIAQRDGFL
jgi:DNA-binding CsgD family transcriptional regulator